MSNYRPISILPVFSKVLEKIVYNRLVAFVKKHNILSQNQHGFWENRSTETACQNFVEFIQKKLDNGQHVIGIFFDLSKTYDVINHEILLDKLDHYGMRENKIMAGVLPVISFTVCRNSSKNRRYMQSKL
jgi:retron-type reverse transcriptase